MCAWSDKRMEVDHPPILADSLSITSVRASNPSAPPFHGDAVHEQSRGTGHPCRTASGTLGLDLFYIHATIEAYLKSVLIQADFPRFPLDLSDREIPLALEHGIVESPE